MQTQISAEDVRNARIAGSKTAIVANCAPEWWRALTPFDAAFHVATCLESLLRGVEDEATLAECQSAASVWMNDLRQLRDELATEAPPLS